MVLILSLDLSFTLRLKLLLMSSEKEPGHRWQRGKKELKRKKRPACRGNVSLALPSRVNFNINCIKWLCYSHCLSLFSFSLFLSFFLFLSLSLSLSLSLLPFSFTQAHIQTKFHFSFFSHSQADDAGECLITLVPHFRFFSACGVIERRHTQDADADADGCYWFACQLQLDPVESACNVNPKKGRTLLSFITG